MQFTEPDIALDLQVSEPVDAAVLAVLQRDLDAMANVLGQWGRFNRPVSLRTTLRQDDLRAAAPCETELHLHGVASVDGLLLWAPSAWPHPPAAHELARLLLHELAHVLLFQRCAAPGTAMAYIPTWFREGMAVVAADGPQPPHLRRALAAHPLLDELPGASDAVMTQATDACYQAAALIFQAWSERFGARGLSALCRAMRLGHGFAAAHASACGMSDAEFVDEWLLAVRAEARSS